MLICGADISMIRGDSESITVSCKNPDGSDHPFSEGDKVYLTVKTDAYQKDPVMQKTVTAFADGEAVIEITPEDTKALDFGAYKYDVQLTYASGRVTTIIPPSSFRVMEEITDE